jgi:hypothetical protein
MDVAIESVDGDLMPVAEARKHARNYFYAGFAFLPLFWAVNAWLFWPAAAPGAGAAAAADPVVRKCAQCGEWEQWRGIARLWEQKGA